MSIIKKKATAAPVKKDSSGAKTASAAKTVKAVEKAPAKAPAKTVAKKAPVKAAEKAPVKAVAKKAEIKDVVFSIVAPLATSVSVAGTFNGWNASKSKLKKAKDGSWAITIPLATGRYEYKFVCDGLNWDEGENKVKNV